jgi:uncharacterized phage protein (TIGR02216 family)
MKPAPFPWDQALAFGFGVLRLSSNEFWAMTPRELAAAIRGFAGEQASPIDRDTFLALARRFPDRPRIEP